jgi:DNA ligase-1
MPTAWKKKNPQAGPTSTPATKGAPKKASEPKNVPSILLAHTWDNEQDVTGWHISEKLDGVRAYWDGTKFLSRLGNVYHAPDYFTEGFPCHPLDGELWIGRGQFQETVSVVRRKNGGEHWKRVRYLVFDVPVFKDLSFEDRHAALIEVDARALYIRRVEQALCRGVDHLREELARIEELGGEGLMLRQPGSLYAEGRSTTLLKIKSFFDAEATVIGHTKGKGRHKGRCGALEVRAADGTEFKVGTGLTDAQRDNPPAIGSVVCYRYQELTKAGVPRFPSFVGIRHDVQV